MSTKKCSLLVVDDEAYLLSPLAQLLGGDFEVYTADGAEAAQAVLTARPIDIILTDQKMPRVTGVQLLEWVRAYSPRTVRLLMTGYAEHEDAVEAINRGQVYYYLLKPWRIEELLQILRNAAEKFQLERSQESLLQQLRHLNQALEQRVAERTRELEEANFLLTQRSRELEGANQKLEQRNLEMERLAMTDPLTGLLNRRAIDQVAHAEIRRRARYHSPLAVGVIDVDHFKHINDTHLLPGGDFVLTHLARTLPTLLRSVDSVGRIGGEEFLVVAPETTVEGAVRMGERIRSAVEETAFVYNGATIPVTVSLGFAVAETGARAEFERMKLVASAAMREAKAGGRNQAVVRVIEAPEVPASLAV